MLSAYSTLLRTAIHGSYAKTFREPGGALQHPFITPGSEQYTAELWDWDSWLFNVALRQIVLEQGDPAVRDQIRPYERGCILNFLSCPGASTGFIPICVNRDEFQWPEDIRHTNMHKPCLAQHAAFLVREDGGDAGWLRESFKALCSFINFYRNHHFHSATGLYYWQDDYAIGVDNDPCTYGRPDKSSGSIYLNCLMSRELEEDARDLAEKTVDLFGRDLERFGDFHEYYEPDNGKPVMNLGFHSWNLLVLNMLAWLEGKPVVAEF